MYEHWANGCIRKATEESPVGVAGALQSDNISIVGDPHRGRASIAQDRGACDGVIEEGTQLRWATERGVSDHVGHDGRDVGQDRVRGRLALRRGAQVIDRAHHEAGTRGGVGRRQSVECHRPVAEPSSDSPPSLVG